MTIAAAELPLKTCVCESLGRWVTLAFDDIFINSQNTTATTALPSNKKAGVTLFNPSFIHFSWAFNIFYNEINILAQ